MWRVSSAAMSCTSFRIRTALNVMSSRLPIGVGTMYSVPVELGSDVVVFIYESLEVERNL